MEGGKFLAGNQVLRWIRQALYRLRLLWDNTRSNRGRFGLTIGIVLALGYFVFAGVIPAVYVKKDYADGATFISLYSPAFRYPQFFGWITVLLLIRPVLYLTLLPGLKRVKDRISVLIVLSIISALMLLINIQSHNAAPFEVRADILQKDERLKNHFTMPGERTVEEKKYYQETMLGLLKDTDNWSAVRYLYYLSVFIQIFNVLFIFAVAGALTIHSLSPNSEHSYEFNEALVYCSLSMLVSIFMASNARRLQPSKA